MPIAACIWRNKHRPSLKFQDGANLASGARMTLGNSRMAPTPAETERFFMNIKFPKWHDAGPFSATFEFHDRYFEGDKPNGVKRMRKAALVIATVATLGIGAITAPAPAEARGGFGPGLAGGLIAGALIGGIASNAYGYGPGYYGGGYAPSYYGGGYAPAYYDGGYAPAYYGGGYYGAYAPVYSGYRYRRVIRPAYAYYGGPRYGGWHHRGYRHW